MVYASFSASGSNSTDKLTDQTLVSIMPKSIQHLDDGCLEHLFGLLPTATLFSLSQLGIAQWNVICAKVFAKKRTLVVFDTRADVEEFDQFFTPYYQFIKLPPPVDLSMPYRKLFHAVSSSASEPLPKYSRPTFCLLSPITLLNTFPNLTKLVLFRVKNVTTDALRSILGTLNKLEYLALIDLNARFYRIPNLMITDENGERYEQTMWFFGSSPNQGGTIDWSAIWPVLNGLEALRQLVLWGLDATLDLSPQLASQLRLFVIGQYKERDNSLLNLCKLFGSNFRSLGMVQIDGSDKLYRWLCENNRQASQLRRQLREFTIDYLNAFDSGYSFQLLSYICNNFSWLNSLSICLKEGDLLCILLELKKLTHLTELRLACFSLQQDRLIFSIPELASVRSLHLKILFNPLSQFSRFRYIFPNLTSIGLERSRVMCKCEGPTRLVDVSELSCHTCLRIIKGYLQRFKHMPKFD